MPQHGVNENVIFDYHTPLDPTTPTIGHALREQGYRTSYIGKWHLGYGPSPDMEAHGFSDWSGNDLHFMGWAGTGNEFDPFIAQQAAGWLDDDATSSTQALEPHRRPGQPPRRDVVPDRPAQLAGRPHPDETELARAILAYASWKEGDTIPTYPRAFDRIVDRLPENFDDDLFTKPAVQRQWLHEQQHSLYGFMDPSDTDLWLRHLAPYVELHRQGDQNLGLILDALERMGRWDDTAIVFTADHGDMCGSHGLRSKGPFVYDEIMNVPLYVKVPGVTTPGTSTDALASHVDIATTIPMLGGASPRSAHLLRPRPHPRARGPVGLGARPHPLRPGHRLVRALPAAPLRHPGCVGRPPQVRPLLRRGRRLQPHHGPQPHPKLFDVDSPFEDRTTSSTTPSRTRTSW